jgi:hypothetical protein
MTLVDSVRLRGGRKMDEQSEQQAKQEATRRLIFILACILFGIGWLYTGSAIVAAKQKEPATFETAVELLFLPVLGGVVFAVGVGFTISVLRALWETAVEKLSKRTGAR